MDSRLPFIGQITQVFTHISYMLYFYYLLVFKIIVNMVLCMVLWSYGRHYSQNCTQSGIVFDTLITLDTSSHIFYLYNTCDTILKGM